MMHLRDLEREEQSKSETKRRKEIIKIRAEISETNTKKQCRGSVNQRVGSLKGWEGIWGDRDGRRGRGNKKDQDGVCIRVSSPTMNVFTLYHNNKLIKN